MGTWNDEYETASAWDEGVSEREIVWQTERVLKENKQMEREKRALEQQRKREEKEAQRVARKTVAHLGIKVTT